MKGEKSKKNEQNAILGQYEARPRRNFSEEFKRSKVKEIIAKKLKVSDLCKLYDVSSVAVYRWIYTKNYGKVYNNIIIK